MATNQYNDSAADLETIPAGTVLYRILAANATYAANSFNPNPRPVDDPGQGRFEPTDPALGGYLYVATSVSGAVAEGVLRNMEIPKSRLVRRIWLRNKKLAFMRLEEDVEVAALYGSHAAKLNLDASFLCCDSTKYSHTRRVATAVMLNTTGAQGIRYPCRNHEQEPALMFISRAPQAVLTITRELNILTDDEGRELVLDTLDTIFGLRYAGPPW
jgi:RES domain